jgi:hypothetical protein
VAVPIVQVNRNVNQSIGLIYMHTFVAHGMTSILHGIDVLNIWEMLKRWLTLTLRMTTAQLLLQAVQ